MAKQRDMMVVTVQGSKRSDVIRMLKKALASVEAGDTCLSEHPDDYDPFVSIIAPKSWSVVKPKEA